MHPSISSRHGEVRRMRSAQRTARNGTQPRKTGDFFRSLSSEGWQECQTIIVPVSYPAGKTLFHEEESPASILILLEGSVKISLNSSDGRKMILRIAKPVELLGLTSVLSGASYDITAETVFPCRFASIPRRMFLDFLTRNPVAYQALARMLSWEMSRACEQMRIIGLSSSAAVRLARLLLSWSASARPREGRIRLSVPLTHAEIGECIGVARETASRAMIELRQRGLIEVRGSVVHIANRFDLAAFAHQVYPVLPPALHPQCPPGPAMMLTARPRATWRACAQLRQA